MLCNTATYCCYHLCFVSRFTMYYTKFYFNVPCFWTSICMKGVFSGDGTLSSMCSPLSSMYHTLFQVPVIYTSVCCSHRTVISTSRHPANYTQCPQRFFTLRVEKRKLCGRSLRHRDIRTSQNVVIALWLSLIHI